MILIIYIKINNLLIKNAVLIKYFFLEFGHWRCYLRASDG